MSLKRTGSWHRDGYEYYVLVIYKTKRIICQLNPFIPNTTAAAHYNLRWQFQYNRLLQESNEDVAGITAGIWLFRTEAPGTNWINIPTHTIANTLSLAAQLTHTDTWLLAGHDQLPEQRPARWARARLRSIYMCVCLSHVIPVLNITRNKQLAARGLGLALDLLQLRMPMPFRFSVLGFEFGIWFRQLLHFIAIAAFNMCHAPLPVCLYLCTVCVCSQFMRSRINRIDFA